MKILYRLLIFPVMVLLVLIGAIIEFGNWVITGKDSLITGKLIEKMVK